MAGAEHGEKIEMGEALRLLEVTNICLQELTKDAGLQEG